MRKKKWKVLKVTLEPGERLWHIGVKPDETIPPTVQVDRHSGIVSVAAKADFDAKTVSMGFSFCSPDDFYIRQKGGRIAIGRLRKYPIIMKFKDKPYISIQRFLMKIFTEGGQLAREAYGLPNKAFRATVEAYLTEGFKCDMILDAPPKAMKHFPLLFPWWWSFQFPETWAVKTESPPEAVAQ